MLQRTGRKHLLVLACAIFAAQSVIAAVPKSKRILEDISTWDYGLKRKPDIQDPGPRTWDAALLKRAINYMNTERLQEFVRKLNSGERVVVTAMGSSVVSDRGGCFHTDFKDVQEIVHTPGHPYHDNQWKCKSTNGRQGFLTNFMTYINTTWPNPKHVLVNSGHPGASAVAFAHGMCLEAHWPKDTDLLIFENHGTTHEVAVAFEQLLWRMNKHFGHMPAVIVINTLRVANRDSDVNCMTKQNCEGECVATFRSIPDGSEKAAEDYRGEQQIHMLGSYYSFASVSLRTVFTLAMRDKQAAPPRFPNACAFYRSVLADPIHQNHKGNVLMADMLVHTLYLAQQDLEARSGATPVAMTPPNQLLMPRWTLYPRGDENAGMRCFEPGVEGSRSGDAIQALNVVKHDGWEFIEYQLHGTEKKYKPGWVATKPGSKLQIQVDATFKGVPASKPVTVALLYLRSYEHMGSASVTCVSGCKCEPSKLQGHDTSEHVSLLHMHAFEVTSPTNKCVVEVEVLSETQSGEHKFKVASATVRGPAMALAALHAASTSATSRRMWM